MSYSWGAKVSDRLDHIVRQKPSNSMVVLGESLGSPKSVTREAKGKRYAKFLKDLTRVLDQLTKITDLAGIPTLEVLFPKTSPDERSMEIRLMERLDMIENAVVEVLREIKNTSEQHLDVSGKTR